MPPNCCVETLEPRKYLSSFNNPHVPPLSLARNLDWMPHYVGASTLRFNIYVDNVPELNSAVTPTLRVTSSQRGYTARPVQLGRVRNDRQFVTYEIQRLHNVWSSRDLGSYAVQFPADSFGFPAGTHGDQTRSFTFDRLPTGASLTVRLTADWDRNGIGAPTFAADGPYGQFTVFVDYDNDRTRDSDEPAVTEYGESSFHFDNLRPGRYRIRASSGTSDVPVAAPLAKIYTGTLPVVDVPFQPVVQFADRVYVDQNENGKYDAGETPRAGILVRLRPLKLSKPAELPVGYREYVGRTDEEGLVRFANVSRDRYEVSHEVPNNSLMFNKPVWKVDLGSYGSKTFETAFSPKTQIDGVVFYDTDGDGSRDEGEDGIAGHHVFVDTNGDGQWQADEPSRRTNFQGVYSFSLEPGEHRISTLDDRADAYTPTTRLMRNVSAAQSLAHAGPRFGYAKGAYVKGTVANVGSVFNLQLPDVPKAGVRVFVDYNDNNRWDANEPWERTGSAGDFRVEDVYRAGKLRITKFPGLREKNAAALIDPKERSSYTRNIDLVADAVVFGTIFLDLDRDGVRDPDEKSTTAGRFFVSGVEKGANGEFFVPNIPSTLTIHVKPRDGFVATNQRVRVIQLAYGEELGPIHFGVAPV